MKPALLTMLQDLAAERSPRFGRIPAAVVEVIALALAAALLVLVKRSRPARSVQEFQLPRPKRKRMNIEQRYAARGDDVARIREQMAAAIMAQRPGGSSGFMS